MESSKDMKALYDFVKVIGTGAYGEVYSGVNKKTGLKVAIKKIRSDSIHEGIPATALREISLLKELNHPNIVKLLDVVIEKHKIYMVFELMTTDLKDFFDKNKDASNYIKPIAYQILVGIKECHSKRILHRDLKPKNILLNVKESSGKKTIETKIADFGLSKAFVVPFRPYTNEVVTLWYRAPEILLGSKDYFTPVDMWSFGCILAEMINGRALVSGDSEIDQINKIFQLFGTPNESIWAGFEQLSGDTKFKQYTATPTALIFKTKDKQAIDLMSVFY